MGTTCPSHQHPNCPRAGALPGDGSRSRGRCAVAYLKSTGALVASQRDHTLHSLLVFSLIGLGAVTLLSGLIGWLMAARVLSPIRTITSAARRASELQLGERISLGGPPDELRDLADTFDSMLDRLDDAFSSQRAFIANASHELRTPLTSMRTAVDVALAKRPGTLAHLEGMGQSVSASVDQAESLIDSLLTLSRSQRGHHAEQFVDLATACEDSLDLVAGQVAARDLHVTATLEPAELTGDRVLLERMVGNLVDNAVRYSDRGGSLRLASGRRNGSVYLEVANSGETLPEKVVPLLLEPFRRATDRVGDA